MTVTPKLGGLKGWLMWIIATTFLLYLFNLQTGYNIINVSVAKDLSLNVSQVSIVASVYSAVFGVLQIFSGPILDRFGIRYVIPCAIVMVATGAWLLAGAQSFTALLIAQIIMALGSIFGFVGAGFAGGEWFGNVKFGYMFGLVQSSAAFSSFFGGNLINELLTDSSWREIIRDFAIFGLALAAIALFFLRDNAQHFAQADAGHGSIFRKLIMVLGVKQLWLSMLLGSVLFGGLLSLAVVWASKVIHCYGLAAEQANRASLVIWLGCGLGAGMMDWISTQVKSHKWVLIANGLLFSGTLILLLCGNWSFIIASVLSFVIGFSSAAHMLAFTVAAKMVSEDLEGTSAAATNSGLYITGTLMIIIPGTLLPHTSSLTLVDFQQALRFIWILALASSILCALFLHDTFRASSHSCV